MNKMFSQKSCYFSQLAKSYPILKLIDVYDRQSFIRSYVLDNIFVCVFMYAIFYLALFYANSVIKRIEKSNREMLSAIEESKMKMDDLRVLKNKKGEYEELFVNTRAEQKLTTKYLEDEVQRLSTELISTTNKLSELEKILGKRKYWEKCSMHPAGDIFTSDDEYAEKFFSSTENIKVLEPSFPPPELPPRKYGIFVARPPGQRRTATALASQKNPFK